MQETKHFCFKKHKLQNEAFVVSHKVVNNIDVLCPVCGWCTLLYVENATLVRGYLNVNAQKF